VSVFLKFFELTRMALPLAALLAVWAATPARSASVVAGKDLLSLSIEDLMQIEVTSVSKHAQKLSEAPAAVTVLTSEDIRRSGMTTIPDMLRMVPGLHVASIDSHTWAVTARGFNGQFANKLLVMIDGRTVYTPLFSGVYWDVQDLVLEDIDRIEVVRGPGGSVWGANAVNGVINVITKKAADTQGLLVSSLGGSLERTSTSARYGGMLGDDVHYRASVKYFNRGDFDNRGGVNAHDEWDVARGAARVDWEPTDADQLTLQGDFYDGNADGTTLPAGPFPPSHNDSDLQGGNVLARWVHSFSEQSDFQLQTYYDRTDRDATILREERDTFDLEVQHHFRPLSRNNVIWGMGYRLTHDDIRNSPGVTFDPTNRTVHLGSAFLQDEISLIPDRVTLTLGSKFEYGSYAGFEIQPTARVLWTPSERHSVWAAVSRAIRAPSRSENDVTLIVPTSPTEFDLLQGENSFDSEELWAYELGYRARPLDFISIDAAAYYNDYDELRSVEDGGTVVNFPFLGADTTFFSGDNKLTAEGYGVELSSTWSAFDFWRLTGGYTLMVLDVHRGNSTDPTAKGQEDDTPEHQFFFRSVLDLPSNFELDAAVYFVGKVRNQDVGQYARFDLRLGWEPIPNLELSLVGQNLAESSHDEFGTSFTTLPTSVPRSGYGKITWRY
jgi:iron complex outermembrane receptor protein